LPLNDFAALTGFNFPIHPHFTFTNHDFGLRAAFHPTFQFQQIAEINVWEFT